VATLPKFTPPLFRIRLTEIARCALVGLGLSAAAALCRGQESCPPPPSYRVLRFDENYSYLADPAHREDDLDALKYIPLLAANPGSFLTIGGEVRERFEDAENPAFGTSDTRNDYWLQRVTLLADAHLTSRIRVFVEGISGLSSGQTGIAPPVQEDPVDLQFAFLELEPFADDTHSVLRLGRFGMTLGAGRLVATRAAPNIPFKFDGGEWLSRLGAWDLTAFVTRPVTENSDKFDSADPGTAFWGIYATDWFNRTQASGVDFYYLGIDQGQDSYASGTAAEHRQTVGARLFGQANSWDWNLEGAYQGGRFGSEPIRAWTLSADDGITFDAALRPRVGLKADVASGSSNASGGAQGTFDALYFKSGYFNDASLIRPANLIDLHPNLAVQVTAALHLDGGVDYFWRYSRSDAIYAPPGFVTLPALPNAPAYVGTATDLNLVWQVQRHISFSASVVHFATGSYVALAHGGPVNYFSTTVDFVF